MIVFFLCLINTLFKERFPSAAMHRTFQRDLYLLRLNTLREYAKSLDNSMNPISSDPTEPLKLNAQVGEAVYHNLILK